MSSRAKGIIISILALAVIAGTILGVLRLVDALKKETYSSAKIECEKFLKKYRVDLERIAQDTLSADIDFSDEYKGHSYHKDVQTGCVQFRMDSQGMLGGQYWYLVYTGDGTYYGQTDEYFEKWDSNNVTKAEHLEGNWWFLWQDYDDTDLTYE